MATAVAIADWQDAVELADLHQAGCAEELDAALMRRLAALLPGVAMALCIDSSDGRMQRVQWSLGASPLQRGDEVPSDAWPLPAAQRLLLCFRDCVLGSLLLGSPPGAAVQSRVMALLRHYGVALANLEIGAEARHAADHYCASLQALQEGIVLFQERDPDAIEARLLALGAAMLGASAGALYLLETPGNRSSQLRLCQVLGMPENLLATFRLTDGSAFPLAWLERPAGHADRASDPTLGGFDPSTLPEALQNVAALPLRYLDFDIGILLLFNAAAGADTIAEQLDRIRNLAQLGSALLYRLHLEAVSARQRMLERELQIAASIQQRLLPDAAPPLPGLEFAWQSVAANKIGGDYIDLLGRDGALHAVIADVSGHGVDSALLMSSFRGTWRAVAPRHGPDALLHELNSVVQHEVGATGMFVTAATLWLDPAQRLVRIASAGHNPVLLYSAATGQVRRIESTGPPLGFAASMDFGCTECSLATGDVVLLYTDGIAEACNQDLDMFGDERIAALLQRCGGEPADGILRRLLRDLRAFTGRDRQDDDVSVSVIKVC